MERELAKLQAEAGIVDSDPGPPSGDLKRDIESFTGIDACVRAHTTPDAVLGDAIDSLGYDTLTRDACRAIEALQAKDQKLCKDIAPSALRARCESNVAVLVGDPHLCPFMGLTKGDARDPLCLARASRDERLCGALIPFRRPSCKAMVTGRLDDCGGDSSCMRQVERWRSLLEKPAKHPDYASRVHVDISPEKGTPEPANRSFDFQSDAAGGAVIRVVGDRLRISLGKPRNAYSTPWDASYAKPEMFLEVARVVGDPIKERNAIAATDLTLEVLLPKVGLFSALTSTDRTLEISRWSQEPGGALSFTITTSLVDAPRSYAAKVEVETFVRDVIDAAAMSEPRR